MALPKLYSPTVKIWHGLIAINRNVRKCNGAIYLCSPGFN